MEKSSGSNKHSSIRRTSKYSNLNNSNVYDSFSMSNKYLEMSSTPDTQKTRYISSKNPSNNYLGLRKSYANANVMSSESLLKIQKGRQSESTKPSRQVRINGRTPSRLRNSRASSNPRMNSRELHNNSSSSVKGRKGQLMSSSKLSKILSEQANIMFDQKERIKKIYEPINTALKPSSSNIKVSDEFPSIKSKHMPNMTQAVFHSDSRGKSKITFGILLGWAMG